MDTKPLVKSSFSFIYGYSTVNRSGNKIFNDGFRVH